MSDRQAMQPGGPRGGHTTPSTEARHDSSEHEKPIRAVRILAGFVAGALVWLGLLVCFLLAYSTSWEYGTADAVPLAIAWCLSTLVGAAVLVLAAGAHRGAQGALLGLALGFIVAGGGLVYSVTGHRPTNSDAWPTDLLVWGIALVLASVSGLAGGWIAGRARARRSD